MGKPVPFSQSQCICASARRNFLEVIPMRKSLFVAAILALTTAVSAHAVKARLDVDKTWLGPTDDLVARVTIINDTQETVLIPKWQVPGQILEADLFAVIQ